LTLDSDGFRLTGDDQLANGEGLRPSERLAKAALGTAPRGPRARPPSTTPGGIAGASRGSRPADGAESFVVVGKKPYGLDPDGGGSRTAYDWLVRRQAGLVSRTWCASAALTELALALAQTARRLDASRMRSKESAHDLRALGKQASRPINCRCCTCTACRKATFVNHSRSRNSRCEGPITRGK
jgi:hypothetical protein